jgi:thioredoxin-related protein
MFLMSARSLHFCALLALPVLAPCAGCDNPKNWDSHTRGLPFLFGYEKGLAEARRADRPIMFFVTTTWCSWCKRLAGDSFTDPRVRKLLENFVLVIVDGDTEPDAVRSLGAAGYPHVVFQSPSGRTLAVSRGYHPADEFLATVKLALSAAGRP